ncbi:LCP family protein [Flexivirga caeni]|uniref:LytR family transcriptional regulator n=1 Tax=Flexivirga caeni TaxID=2294115 RepID=A0A3M9M577_9MICO|nr:LCP family protein [Flexivirga caeni]RNI20682.1 LytR family transcriptional regulator [Flexivirga caeni]
MTDDVRGVGDGRRAVPKRDPDDTIIATRRELERRQSGAARTPLRSRHDRRIARARDVRRALGLTALSVLLPGLGLLWTKRRMIGLLLIGITLIGGISLAIIVSSGGLVHGAAQLLTHKGLVMLLLFTIMGGLLWIGGIVLTALTTTDRRWPHQTRWMHAVFATLMCLVVAAPAAYAARDVIITRNAFDQIFTKRYTNDPDAATPKGGSNPWKNIPRVNLLLVGSDAGADRYSQRPDSMMVASIDTKTGDTVLVSVPRNMGHAPFPASSPLHKLYPGGLVALPGQTDAAAGLMESVWAVGIANKNLYPKDDPSPGLSATRDAITGITGLKIDYTAVIDMSGFEQLVNAMGGVWVNVKADPGQWLDPQKGIPIGGVIQNGQVVPGSITGYIKLGYQKLDGREALWYSRSRVASSDDQRMRRQRCMLNDLISQANPFQMVQKFPSIMQVAAKNIRIDINQDDLPAFATLADQMKHGNIRTVDISNSRSNANPDFAQIHRWIQQAIARKHTKKKAPAPGQTTSATSSPSTPSSSTTTNPISDTADSC